MKNPYEEKKTQTDAHILSVMRRNNGQIAILQQHATLIN